MTILWVENHLRFSQIAVKSFLAAHVVTVTPSIVAARQCLAGMDFDLVMLDCDLDDGKGTELVRQIIDHPFRPKLIAASSHLRGNQALLDAGADAMCSKMDFANIEQVIATLSSRELSV